MVCQRVCQNLTRRKPSQLWQSESSPFRRCLNTFDLTTLGVGTVVGAGLYVVAGQLARDIAGPAVILSFVIAGIAAFLSGICYAEYGCRIPKAGSAYVYTYVTMGEVWAFFVGWNLLLEYLIAAATLARACSEYINSVCNGVIYKFLMKNVATWHVPVLGPFPDVLAMGLSFIVTVIVSLGVRQTAAFNKVVTFVNFSVILFIIVCGLFYIDGDNWQGQENFIPYGVGGILTASASCFYAFVGFDVIATASEETINPKRALPLAIFLTLVISFLAYFGATTVLTLMLPYNQLNRFAPLAEAFNTKTFAGSKYIIAAGGLAATASSLLSNVFAASRVVYAIASDGLLCKFFGVVNEKTLVPVRSALCNGILIGTVALLFDVKQLVELLSIGTLIAFTMMSLSVILTRFQPGVESVNYQDPTQKELTNKWLKGICCEKPDDVAQGNETYQPVKSTVDEREALDEDEPEDAEDEEDNGVTPDEHTGYIAGLCLAASVILITSLNITLTNVWHYLITREAWALFVTSLIGLLNLVPIMILMRQPRNKATFPFMVPCIPYVPLLSVFVNVLLIVKLNYWTYVRFGVWMCVGILVYGLYGYTHSIEAHRPGTGSKDKHVIMPDTPALGHTIQPMQPFRNNEKLTK